MISPELLRTLLSSATHQHLGTWPLVVIKLKACVKLYCRPLECLWILIFCARKTVRCRRLDLHVQISKKPEKSWLAESSRYYLYTLKARIEENKITQLKKRRKNNGTNAVISGKISESECAASSLYTRGSSFKGRLRFWACVCSTSLHPTSLHISNYFILCTVYHGSTCEFSQSFR